MDIMRLAAAERAEFADFLDTLTAEQWDAPSLCAGWRVRDVVAHAVSFDELDGRGVVGRVLKAGFSPSRVNELGVEAYRDHTPAELVAVLRAHLEPSGVNAAFGGLAALADTVIHHQDIRRPLGIPRQVPAERLGIACRACRTDDRWTVADQGTAAGGHRCRLVGGVGQRGARSRRGPADGGRRAPRGHR